MLAGIDPALTAVAEKDRNEASMFEAWPLKFIFVGDRGMITKTVADKIKGIEDLHTISSPVRKG